MYEGRWERDLRNGQGKLVYWNKSHYDGLWKNDMVSEHVVHHCVRIVVGVVSEHVVHHCVRIVEK